VPTYYDNDFTTLYRSANLFGKAHIVTDEQEKIEALRALCLKVLPFEVKKINRAITSSLQATAVVRIDIEYLSGKSNMKRDDK
jgi:nitroimidazol reductase NimA-like FMN-containing flavoprotein (pyridoxamine 5'-phosphate oxidase superfamily)